MTSVSNLLSVLIINPAVILTIGAFLAVQMPPAFRKIVALFFVAASAYQFFNLGLTNTGEIELFGHTLVTLRIDQLSRIFGVVFHIAIALNLFYGWHEKEDRAQNFANLSYPAACLGGVLSGDFLTLFLWWEIAAITSVLLIWVPGTLSLIHI